MKLLGSLMKLSLLMMDPVTILQRLPRIMEQLSFLMLSTLVLAVQLGLDICMQSVMITNLLYRLTLTGSMIRRTSLNFLMLPKAVTW